MEPDDGDAGRDIEGDGEENQPAGRSGGHRSLRPDDAPLARGVCEVRLYRTDEPADNAGCTVTIQEHLDGTSRLAMDPM